MPIPKKYFHDRIVLLLLSMNAFLAILGTIAILLRIDTSRPEGYIIQYRSNLGLLSGFKSGNATTFISFIVFEILVFVFHTILSMRVYHIRRHFSIVILGMGSLLLALAFIVSNALLGMR